MNSCRRTAADPQFKQAIAYTKVVKRRDLSPKLLATAANYTSLELGAIHRIVLH